MERSEGTFGSIRVLGVGNVLTSDDGIGPYAVAVLKAGWTFPDDVSVVDVGTPGLDFTPYLTDAELVVVVDAVRSSGAPGTIRVWRDDELLAAPPVARTNPHEPGLREALMATEFEDRRPRHIVLVGIVPQSVETGTRLSDPVRSVVDPVAETVVAELVRIGVTVRRKDRPDPLDVWWE
jgi:hydrogenase maturation protease